MDENIQQLFEWFLIDNDCYSQFLNNLLEQYKCSLEEYFEHGSNITMANNSSEDLVLNAFWWCDTDEKTEYWKRISIKWVEVLNNYLSSS